MLMFAFTIITGLFQLVAQKNQAADGWIESKLGIVKNHPKIELVGKKIVDFNWIYCFNWSVKMHIFAGTWQRIRLTRLYVLSQTESTIFCQRSTERQIVKLCYLNVLKIW